MDWVEKIIDGEKEIYYDRKVRSQEDVNNKYGADSGITHISSGTSYSAYDKEGNELARYQFWNDASDTNSYGAITDANGNLYADDKIIYGGSYTIFGTSDNSVNAETLYKNLSVLGFFQFNSYIGGYNPLTYNKRYSYQFLPKRLSEYPPIRHDKDYDALGIAGISGVFGSTRGWKADLDLANSSAATTIISLCRGNLQDARQSWGVSVTFGPIGAVKAGLHPITIGIDKINQKMGEAVMKSHYTPYINF
jgi:hypothetical protein